MNRQIAARGWAKGNFELNHLKMLVVASPPTAWRQRLSDGLHVRSRFGHAKPPRKQRGPLKLAVCYRCAKGGGCVAASAIDAQAVPAVEMN